MLYIEIVTICVMFFGYELWKFHIDRIYPDPNVFL